jgi:hypothetical protein
MSYNDKSSVPNIGCMEGLQINCYRWFASLERRIIYLYIYDLWAQDNPKVKKQLWLQPKSKSMLSREDHRKIAVVQISNPVMLQCYNAAIWLHFALNSVNSGLFKFPYTMAPLFNNTGLEINSMSGMD